MPCIVLAFPACTFCRIQKYTVIDGIKRNSRIYVGDSIVRKTDTRLSKEEDVVVCLPGARIEHVTERE